MSDARRPLSLSKFRSLLQHNSYTLSTVYCVDHECKFIELRTPKIQKTFLIHIPERYVLTIDDTVRVVDMQPIDSPPFRHATYLTELKGSNLQWNIVSVSSTILCATERIPGTKDSIRFDCYFIGPRKRQSSKMELIDEDPVLKIVADTDKIMYEVTGTGLSLPTEEVAENTTEDENPEDEDVEVQLEFQNDDGTPLDTNDGVEVDDIHDAEEHIVGAVKSRSVDSDTVHITPKPKLSSLVSPIDNSLPSNMVDRDLYLGIIYILVDIGTFFKNISGIEDQILAAYDTLDENEAVLRDVRLTRITEMCELLSVKLSGELERIKNEETELKSQLTKLTVVYNSALQLKASGNSKVASMMNDIDRIYNQSRSTIAELNVELMRLRDRTDELLTNYDWCLTDLSEMLDQKT